MTNIFLSLIRHLASMTYCTPHLCTHFLHTCACHYLPTTTLPLYLPWLLLDSDRTWREGRGGRRGREEGQEEDNIHNLIGTGMIWG